MNVAHQYQTGFGNYLSSQAIPHALPEGQNSPQKTLYNLYTEQLSGTPFTLPRAEAQRAWLYRIRPSLKHGEFFQAENYHFLNPPFRTLTPPTQMRWDPLPLPDSPKDFLQGLITFAGNGNPQLNQGAAIHLYAANLDMTDHFFYNADGEFLIVPQEGELLLKTEFGELAVAPGECAIMPRGVKYQVQLLTKPARGYVLENFGKPFRLPELGTIGSNGLANPRDFQYPTAKFEELAGDFTLYAKFSGSLWGARIPYSPLDVVAWHGNYSPYKYDLKFFNTINSVSFDHPDPSIFTVLTSPSDAPGSPNVDFVIFPERWQVSEHTFRPPYFHRNRSSEFMGLIWGKEGKREGGFMPGGTSLHNCMSAHGPDTKSFEAALKSTSKPKYLKNILAIMFESALSWQLSEFALDADFRQGDYLESWAGLDSRFEGPPEGSDGHGGG